MVPKDADVGASEGLVDLPGGFASLVLDERGLSES